MACTELSSEMALKNILQRPQHVLLMLIKTYSIYIIVNMHHIHHFKEYVFKWQMVITMHLLNYEHTSLILSVRTDRKNEERKCYINLFYICYYALGLWSCYSF